jgi:hypothetical protein
MYSEGSNVNAPWGFRFSLWSTFSLPFLNGTFLIKLSYKFKTKKEKTTMATRKSRWILLGIFVTSAWIVGFVIEARAETMKCKFARVTIKDERMPVSHEEGRSLWVDLSEGLAFFEKGDVANFKSHGIVDGGRKSSQAISYVYFTFEDGSSIVVRNEYSSITDPSGKLSSKSAGEIIKGTGRFEGIKGTYSSTGKRFPPIKGETVKYWADATLTYTLSPK